MFFSFNSSILEDGRNPLLGCQSSEEDLLDVDEEESFEVQRKNFCCSWEVQFKQDKLKQVFAACFT